MALTAAIPREVAEAMVKLGVNELAPGGRAWRIAGKVIHFATAEGRKRALNTETGGEVDPRTERPLGERAVEAVKGIGGFAAGQLRAMVDFAVKEAVKPMTDKIAELEKKLEGKEDKKK